MKDLSAELLARGAAKLASAHRIDLRAYEEELPEIDEVLSIAAPDLVKQAWAIMQLSGEEYGDEVPWKKARHQVRLRPGEVSCWIGPNGDGKSLALGHAMGHLGWNGTRVGLASLEMPAPSQIARMVTQLACTAHPSRAALDNAIERLSESVTFWNHFGPTSPKRMLAVARYLALEVKVSHLVIDNLTVICPPGKFNDEEATRFVGGLLTLSRDIGVSIHLVCHVRKPTEFRLLNRHDLRGTGAVADIVDNVLVVQRNEAKSRAPKDSPEAAGDKPDVYFIPDKERSHLAAGDRRPIGLWWYYESLRLSGYNDIPEPYT